ncbi:16S rRNA (guanine(966)-N(2))-methyltransferase RsmD [Coxiella burnetii]|uniref:Ribosomal RNA small subunit methyltransferase D n=2 Tax=Coxiella burnetii TaxID=777 RepID=Q83AI7_COXBU|nr:16S rRNA (guanine(966)-N(2))-methyltransferase RsmD [Coxiella burnetii]NP_820876.1 methyltransferase [Coxiella burnetii RSA 493]AAO91390.1 methyltransferase [Coxiella burnetii RSA 493]ABS77877.1 methyltransferase [Coxiella burnetii Dugway 5J108-111]ABX79127.1 putative methyltransferase [Coxiella burnetii RSA 331]AIT62381.1 RNA methyltransferase, RsmD family [Coxiella burnetii str. Namibia]AML48213.1 16S rRNA (guanine(966)-N(2))-methyltransferase RsmD [Coxiella burnetii]
MGGKLRIIGGKWRSRKIDFPDLPDLRPTTDRIRETLFNWLAPYIVDANCLDLFAGSGALGFEALSRGAAQVTFVDHSRYVVDKLRKNVEILQATNAQVLCGDFTSVIPFLTTTSYNIVFLDPPFYKNLVERAALHLEESKLLAPNAFIYVETEKNLKPLPLPKTWKIYREKATSSLAYYLFQHLPQKKGVEKG